MLEIREEKLQDLLNRRSCHIKTHFSLAQMIVCLASFFISLVLSNILDAPLKVKICVGLLSLVYLVAFALTLYGSNYSVDAFYQDICNVAEKEHNFSLILFKDVSGKYPENYILNYEKRWKCWLFPFIRTNVNDDKKSVENYIKNVFRIEDFKIEQITEENFTKHSASANMSKTYHHTFYLVAFDSSKTLAAKRVFKVNRQKYKWFTTAEMKACRRTMERNSENIEYIEKTF